MSAGMPMDGLATEQAPPLSIPATFFCTAPVAIIAAGALLLSPTGGAALATRWLPATMALTHLGTLGFLGAVMLGALYQMIPVVAGKPVPLARAAHAVHAVLVVGLGALVWGLLSGASTAFWVAVPALGAALLAFLVPVGIALVRAPTKSHTVTGMRLAIAGLALVATFGVWMAHGRARGAFGGDWTAWVGAHFSVGIIVWIGSLISAVSWQVVPMFYLAPEAPRWSRLTILWCIVGTAVSLPVKLALGTPARVMLLAAGSGAVAIWLLHPIITARQLRHRRRKRPDGSLRFWWLGLACAPPTLLVLGAAHWLDHPRWPVLFGWLALWGWAGSIVHGMLCRIVPFLVWFHRFSALVGRQAVPPMRRLWPERRIRIGLWLHAATLVCGCAAILVGGRAMTSITGIGLAATGIELLVALVVVLRHRPSVTPLPSATAEDRGI